MNSRRKPPRRSRRSEKSITSDRELPDKFVVMSMDSDEPVVMGLANPDDPASGYMPLTVSKAERDRLLADPEKLYISPEDTESFLCYMAEHGETPRQRREAATALRQLTRPGGLFEYARMLSTDPTTPLPPGLIREDFPPTGKKN
jgi:hypothetical protein